MQSLRRRVRSLRSRSFARRKDCRLLIGSLHRSDADHSLSLEKYVFVFEEDIDGHTLYALRLVVGNAFGTAILVQEREKGRLSAT